MIPSVPTTISPLRAMAWRARFRAWLGRHPVVFVALLSPGIVEYLSGSSRLDGLVIAPPLFLLFLAGNLGLYVPGVLLIREARRRWRGGWGTVVLLGIAYAITEEGLALSTLFNPQASVVGALGSYGHYLGVSWVWLVGVVAVHVVFSISIPILLFDLAFPDRRSAPLVGATGLRLALGALAVTTSAFMALIYVASHFFAGWPIVLGSLAAIGTLTFAAYSLPRSVLRPFRPEPSRAPVTFALIGLAFWPSLLLVQGLLGVAGAPALVTVLALGAGLLGYLYVVLSGIGRRSNERHLIALVVGLVLPLLVVAAVIEFRVPVILIAEGAAAWFFLFLWRRYRPRPGARSTAVGAIPG
ncbi:MAG TPA: hypothetical protein VJQ43_02405 [Thermoplasmata archaeon]|nr:hypothetical protein [Thermoplasmata archaeon]